MPINIAQEAKEERELYINGLNNVITCIDTVLNRNGSVQNYNQMAANSDNQECILTSEESDMLRKINKAAEQKVNQIKANQFIVAVVGVSGSGKSAATNAIVVGKNLLPVSNTECTLAETEIHYGSESKANVTFYTKEEFRKKFITTLEGLNGFPTDKIETAKKFQNPNEYQRFNLEFEQWLHRNETNESQTGVKELKNILNNIHTIWKHIDHENLELENVTKAALEQYITNKETSPAVKKIVIYSPILKGMQNAIFKDMPGIGTTTKSFSSMSAKAILDADAVLLVKKFDEPVDTDDFKQLFTEVRANLKSEDEKRRFTEKIFLFLNQADRANAAQLNETPEVHLNILMESLNRMDDDFRKLLKDHMVIGSAMAFAPEEDLDDANKMVKENALKNLIENGFYQKEATTTCIEIIREKLQSYNDTIRQKARIEEARAIQAEAVTILGRYENQYTPEDHLAYDFSQTFQSNLTNKLNNYIEKTANAYNSPQADTAKSIIEVGATALEAEMKYINEEDPAWQRIRASGLWDYTYSSLPYDYYFRKQKQTQLQLVFEKAIKNAKIPNLGVFSPNCTTILSVIQNIILDALDIDSDGTYYKELYDAVGKYLLGLDYNAIQQANTTKFDYGIYVDTLFTFLITIPFHSPERWDYYNSPVNRKIFTDLDQAYTSHSTGSENKNDQALISKMLFHKTRKEFAKPYMDEFVKNIRVFYAEDADDISISLMEIIERIAAKKLDLTKDIRFSNGSLEEFLKTYETEIENELPRRFTCLHYKQEMNYEFNAGDEQDAANETKQLSKTPDNILNAFKEDMAVLIDALRNALPYCLFMNQQTVAIVSNVCNYIIQDSQNKLCTWIVNDDTIKVWISSSKSSASIARNKALKQIHDSYTAIENWLEKNNLAASDSVYKEDEKDLSVPVVDE